MNSPPAVRPANDIRYDPGNASGVHGLDFRTHDGRQLICTLTGEQVTQALSEGSAEVVRGRHGRYMRTISAETREVGRFTGPKTWLGPPAPGKGAPTDYEHNGSVCRGFRQYAK